MPLLYFIVMVGVLVFVHELGHFAWAKVFGVRVLKFSLGFGPRIAGFSRGGTEYVISAFPLGGYVRMLGENPRDEVRARERGQSFAEQSILRRMVIVTGGPMMNLTFPILLYFVVFLGDTALTPATIGVVFPNRPAHGLLEPGDRVVAIDGDPIETFYELARAVESSPGSQLRFTVEREGEQLALDITPVSDVKELPLEMREQVGRIGVMPHHPQAVVGVASAGSPAGASRLRTFDLVVAAAGRPVHSLIDLSRTLEKNRGSMVPLTYLRPTPVQDALGGLVELDVYEPRLAALTPDSGSAPGLERAGVQSADLFISHVTHGSPEHRAGLLPGDRLLELDGRPIQLWATFLQDLRAGRGRKHRLRYLRAGEMREASYALEHRKGVTEHGQVFDRYVVGIRNWVPTAPDPPVPNPNPLLYAVRESFRATTEVVQLTVFSVVRLLQGRLSVKSIGGPLTIFEVAGTAAREGALNYLTLMAFISINLGLINLLPIPLLDGGHLPFFFYEGVARRPVGVKAREYAHIAGFVVLVGLMVLAFKNDIERQWPQIVQLLKGP
ncbi:MAG: site-2 protease family protein [Myxococcales bacterium]|nr:site-2 protease family protein [Myxococcales bacterium]